MLRLHAQYTVNIALSSERRLEKVRGIQAVVAIDQEIHSKRLARISGININTVRLWQICELQILARSHFSEISQNLETRRVDLLYDFRLVCYKADVALR